MAAGETFITVKALSLLGTIIFGWAVWLTRGYLNLRKEYVDVKQFDELKQNVKILTDIAVTHEEFLRKDKKDDERHKEMIQTLNRFEDRLFKVIEDRNKNV